MFQLYNTMKNIWGFLPLLEEKRRLGLLRWKNIYGQGCKVGRKNFCLKLEMRLWSRLSFNPFLLTRWVFLKCWFVCVRKLKQWFVSFGRAKVIKKRSIGWSGSHCVHQNRLVESVLEISKNLIMLYWPNRCGDWFTKKILCFTRFLVRILPLWEYYGISCSSKVFLCLVEYFTGSGGHWEVCYLKSGKWARDWRVEAQMALRLGL